MTVANDQSLESLRVSLREQMNSLADHISTGGCQNFEEYKESCGEITGLAWAERELLDLDERLGDG